VGGFRSSPHRLHYTFRERDPGLPPNGAELPPPPTRPADHTHPASLDNALQLGAACATAASDRRLLVPAAFNAFAAPRANSGGARLRASADVCNGEAAQSQRSNHALLGSSGVLLARVKGLDVRAMRRGTVPPGAGEPTARQRESVVTGRRAIMQGVARGGGGMAAGGLRSHLTRMGKRVLAPVQGLRALGAIMSDRPRSATLPAVFGDHPTAAAAAATAAAAAAAAGATKAGVVVKKGFSSLHSVQAGPDTNSFTVHDFGHVALGGPQRPSLESVPVRPGSNCSQNIRGVAFDSRDESFKCVEGRLQAILPGLKSCPLSASSP